MKTLKLTTLALLITATLTTPALSFGPLDIDASMAMKSQYAWRGMVRNTEAVMQPTVGIGLLGLQLEYFGSMDMSDMHNMQSQFNESEWTLGYELGLPFLSFGAGIKRYSFPNTIEPGTSEVFLQAQAHVLFSPSLTLYQDIDEYKGTYWDASVQHKVAVSPAVEVELTAGVGLGSPGYTEGYFGPATILPQVPQLPGNAAITDFYLTAGVPFDLALFFTVTPSVSYSTLAGDVKTIVESTNGVYYEGATSAVIWSLSAEFHF